MAAGGHFEWAKSTFDRFFFTKWLQAAISDDRKSLFIAFLAISDQYATFISHKMAIRNYYYFLVHNIAAGGHFGWPKITFDRISCHFRSIRNFNFFHKMAAVGHLGCPKITFDQISRHIRSIQNFFFSQNGCRQPFWMTENHFWSHYSPFQINTQLFFQFFFQNGRRRPLWKSDLGHFGWPKITFDRISRHFRSIHNFSFCIQNGRRRPFRKSDLRQKQQGSSTICIINGYAKYEVDRWIYDTVRDATSFLSIFIQNGHQRPFCFSDWCQKS